MTTIRQKYFKLGTKSYHQFENQRIIKTLNSEIKNSHYFEWEIQYL
jgi:hypothetical protein